MTPIPMRVCRRSVLAVLAVLTSALCSVTGFGGLVAPAYVVPASAEDSGIRVTVDLPEDVQFDHPATLRLTLADIALQDAPMRELAVRQLVFAGKVRHLTVMLDTTQSDLGSCRADRLSCAFLARITEDGRLRFINDTSHPYKPGEHEARVKVIAVP